MIGHMITLEQAKARQNEVKAQAQRLLNAFMFMELFNQYGEYEIRGSFAADLMLKPDIDGTIYVKEDNLDNVLKLTSDLIRTFGIQSVAIDNRAFPDKGAKNTAGYVIRMKVPFEGVKWNFDIHMMRREDSTGHNYLGEHTYSESQHDAMLLIKAQLTEQRLYPGSSKVPGSFASVDIYRAVIKDGVTNTDALHEWAKTHDYYSKVKS